MQIHDLFVVQIIEIKTFRNNCLQALSSATRTAFEASSHVFCAEMPYLCIFKRIPARPDRARAYGEKQAVPKYESTHGSVRGRGSNPPAYSISYFMYLLFELTVHQKGGLHGFVQKGSVRGI